MQSDFLSCGIRSRARLVRRVHRLRRPLALVGVAAIVLGLALPILTEGLSTGPRTHPMTAAVAFLAAAQLLSDRLVRRRRTRRRGFALAGLGLCLLRAAELFTTLPVPPVHDAVGALVWGAAAGSMGPASTLCFGLLHLTTLARSVNGHLARLCLAVTVAAVLDAFVSVTWGLHPFGRHMAPLTLVALLCLTAAKLSLWAHRAPFRSLLTDDPSGRLLRRLVGVAAAGPWIAGLVVHRMMGVPDRIAATEEPVAVAVVLLVVATALAAARAHETDDRKRRLRERDTHMASRLDPLTGLLNRAALRADLPRRMDMARARGGTLHVVLIDLDHFKEVNDVLGHGAGDAVLRSVADALGAQLRAEDTLCRWGGEEFLLVLGPRDAIGVPEICERLRRRIGRIMLPAPLLRPLTASIGVAALREGETTVDACIERADRAMYRAKNGGRDRVVFFRGGISVA